MNAEQIAGQLAACGLPCDGALAGRLAVYGEMLLDWNTRMDLTAVTEEDGIILRHFADSLSALAVPGLVPAAGRLIDVGTGAGFPGMVLALACPQLQVTLLDALQKRLNFLAAVAEKTGAANVTLVHARAEDGARQGALREAFDVAAARAVAPLNVLAEYLLPYVRVGGVALCWKGPALAQELEAGRRAAHVLGGRAEEPVPVHFPGLDWEHSLLPLRKLQPTPKAYPRKAGTPARDPLGQPRA
ncbi:MAG: 16S rRNA (guanine(527)-N(7))-methyltransferase RsmG [Clostridia bacterium]|nr:16S rRNA (guanine(527)-N(7))-methyltransferase RsmG [Clostridia bacterium]